MSDPAARRRLRMLYRKIPSSGPCLAGCIDCCGPVAWSFEEFERVRHDLPLHAEWVTIRGASALLDPTTMRCPFASVEHGCKVYERRPFICRMYASVEDTRMRCPHGCNAKRPLEIANAVRLTRSYQREPTAPQGEQHG
jgi:Fe-S-cluster containining protein